MRERATKTAYMGGTTRKATLSSADLAEALKAPVTAVSFIPAANLDEEIILSRFGQPAQRVRSNGHLEHFLYPDKGLDLTLDSEGKELLQYVVPAGRAPASAFAERGQRFGTRHRPRTRQDHGVL